jgi:group II intron reverse transcriptase/maturase
MATKDLLEQFLSKNNFLSAYRRIASRKASGGIDGVTVEAFSRHLDKNIQRLQEQIRCRRYVPQPVKTIHIPKFKEENEWRELGLPVVADKVVQAALLQVVEPIAEKMFLDASYWYRPGKGSQKALRRVEHNLRYGKKPWVVHREIDNFFDTLNHDLLLSRFSELVSGEPILIELVALWCKMGLVEKNGRWRNVQAGVRQGHIISPFLANLYLHPLDQFLNQLGIAWVRYADNILLQCKTEEEAKGADDKREGQTIVIKYLLFVFRSFFPFIPLKIKKA